MIPSSGLGISATFPADQFRSAIKFAMQMGAPSMVGRDTRFIRKGTGRTYFLNGAEVPVESLRLDRDGKPLNPEVRVVASADEEVTGVDVAIEVIDVPSHELPTGNNLKPKKATVTVLDVDYDKIEGCKLMRYNGDLYAYNDEPTDNGLFEVDVHTLVFYALDES